MPRLLCLTLIVSLSTACSDGLMTIESPAESSTELAPIDATPVDQTPTRDQADTDLQTDTPQNTNNEPDAAPEPQPEPEPEPEPTCTQGMLCGTECVDTNQNNNHCGACDSRCTGGQVCNNATCVTLSEVEGVLLESNQVRATGADCGVYGEYGPTTPLALDPHLNEAAQAHAQDMADNDFFSHTGSDGSSFSVRVGRTAFSGFPIGENIAAGQRSPADVVASWINSDGHCRNIMNPSATKIGIGYTTGGPYGTLWVQVFGQ